MELHVDFLPKRVNSPGFETLSYQLVANAHILRLDLIIADTLSWGVQRQSYQHICTSAIQSAQLTIVPGEGKAVYRVKALFAQVIGV